MRVEQPGHSYIVEPLGTGEPQRLEFCRRSSRMVDYGEGEHPGTNTQEILRVIIDLAKVVANRTDYLMFIGECNETGDAIAFAEMIAEDARLCLYSFEVRAARRKLAQLNQQAGQHGDDGDINNTRQGFQDIPFTHHDIELLPVGDDGHVLCGKTDRGVAADPVHLHRDDALVRSAFISAHRLTPTWSGGTLASL